MTETEEQMKNYLDLQSLKNRMLEPTCYKSQTATCIALVLTNRNRSVQQTTTIETGLSDFHKIAVTVLKTTFQNKGQMQLTTEITKISGKLFLEMIFVRN